MNAGLIRRLFYLLLGIAYITAGVYIYVKQIIPTPPWGLILMILFSTYGLWRIYRGLKSKV